MRVVGEITADGRLLVTDPLLGATAVDMPIDALLGKTPRMTRDVRTVRKAPAELSTVGSTIGESLDRLLCLPTIADKSFLITIGDRSVGGMISRDQMVGPWQVPVADVAVSLNSYDGYGGEAMAMGERSPVAVLNAPASGRLAVGEAITNILAADIGSLGDIRLSANWMAACGEPGEDADLYATVRAVGVELCASLGLTIPVGKDSLSMRTAWQDAAGDHAVIAPVSVVISAFAPVQDARATLTPELDLKQPSRLLLIDLGAGKDRLGASCWAQVHAKSGGEPADLDDPGLLLELFAALRELKDRHLLLAYHDRSDGGVLLTVLEMAFAAHCGLAIDLGSVADPIAACFAEELGAVLQVPASRSAEAHDVLARHGLAPLTRDIGEPRADGQVEVRIDGRMVYCASRLDLQRRWSEVSFRLQEMRDNPECAREEYERLGDAADPGLHARLDLRSERGCGGAVRRARCAPRDRHPARTRRQQPDRDGRRVHPRRVRCVRCAHDRYSERPGAAGAIPRPGRLRRIFLRRRVGRGGGLGEVDPLQQPGTRGICRFLCTQRDVHFGRLQRLSNVVRAQGADPGGGGLAAVRAQSIGTI